MSFCSKCGAEISAEAAFCEKCGAPVNAVAVSKEENAAISKKSRLVTFLLGFFLGAYGAHNFYLGKIGRAVVQLLMSIGGLIVYIAGIFSVVFTADIGFIAEESILGFLTIPILGLLVMCASTIWAFVEWIMALCGALKDKNGLPVKKWTD